MNSRLFPLDDGNEMEYVLVGRDDAKTCIVFLNGSFFNYLQWRSVLDLLSGYKPLVAWKGLLMNYRGFGKAPPVSKTFTVESLAADVITLLDHLALHQDIVLAGLSLGSLIGTRLLIDHSHRFESMCCYGYVAPVPAMKAHLSGIFKAFQDKVSLPVFHDGSTIEARIDLNAMQSIAPVFWDVFVDIYKDGDDSMIKKGYSRTYARYLYRYLEGTPITTLNTFLDSMKTEDQVWFPSGRIPVPVARKTRVVQGTMDKITSTPIVEEFNRETRLGSLTLLEGMRHTDIMHDPRAQEAFLGVLMSLLAGG